MTLLIQHFLDGTSFCHSEGRSFWSHLRIIREEAHSCWDFWPDCDYPYQRPHISTNLFKCVPALVALLPAPRLPHEFNLQQVPKLQWCFSNWMQFEIVLRHLARHIDTIFDKYGTHTKNVGDENSRINATICFNLLRGYLIQLPWWYIALFVL